MAWSANGGKQAMDAAAAAIEATKESRIVTLHTENVAREADEARQLTEDATANAKIETEYIISKRPLIDKSIADAADAKTKSEAADGKSDNAVLISTEAKTLIIAADGRSAAAVTSAAEAVATSKRAEDTAKASDVKATSAMVTSKAADAKSKTAIDRADNIIANVGNSNTEIVDSRLRIDGSAAPTLGRHLREISTDFHRQRWGVTPIQVKHDMDDYPSVHVVVLDGFGINGFGYGGYSGGDRYQTQSRVEYIDSNNLLIHVPEDFVVTANVTFDGTVYKAAFDGMDARLEIYLRGNN